MLKWYFISRLHLLILAQKSIDDILKAAQALGDKSMTPETVRELIEPMLDGALRSVAAESDIQDLLQKTTWNSREKVKDACGSDLKDFIMD